LYRTDKSDWYLFLQPKGKCNRKEHFAKLVSNNEISKNEYNLSVSSYVEQEDTKEQIDIKVVNEELSEIVKKQNVLRTQIDEIVADLEGWNNE
jgi:type I restriction enzyme M protein